MKNYILSFVLLFAVGVNAQMYTPLDTADYKNRLVIAKQYEKTGKALIKEMSNSYTGEERRFLREVYSEFFNEIADGIKGGEYVYNTVFSDKVEEILNKLRANNPQIPSDIDVWISKDVSLNAYCMLDGTLVVNMGAFYWLENEDQLAAIISHELGHYLLKHAANMQLRRYEQSKSSEEKAKGLKKEKYSVNERAFSEIKKQLYELGEHKRKDEMEADSLGYILYKNSGKFKDNYLSSMNLVEYYNELKPSGVRIATYEKLYDIPGQPFKPKWLDLEDFSHYNYENYQKKIDSDSVKSHPEMDERMFKLKSDFPELKDTLNMKAMQSKEFRELQYTAEMQIIPNLYNRKAYGTAAYYCMAELQRENIDPDREKYFKQWLGKNFKALEEARRDYTFNRYVEQIAPNDEDQSESYKLFLSFLWNLNLSELKNIGDFYLNQ